MTINSNLFTIANSGVTASNTLLSTTGRNIANVNTEGYVRETTQFIGEQHGGVGQGTTERVLSSFATNQLRRDTTNVGELTSFAQNTGNLDSILANEANSVTQGMSSLFAAIQTAADDPTNLPSRDLVIGQTTTLLGRMSGIGSYMDDLQRELNLSFDNQVQRANSLIQNIADLNESISVVSGNGQVGDPNVLMNERDLNILELAEILSIETRVSQNGTGAINVSLSSGEALIMDTGKFNILQMSSEADLNFRTLELNTEYSSTASKLNTSIHVTEENIGGALGGLFKFRNDVLEPTARELGQMALVLADNLNQQNAMGMDLDQQIGSDIIAVPEFAALNYIDNANLDSEMYGRLTPGASHQLIDSDYRITILKAPSGGTPNTFDISIDALDPDGAPTLDEFNNPITQTLTVSAEAATFTPVNGGIELEFPSGNNYVVGDRFLIQPTRNAATEITMATTRAEDLAFAAPLRAQESINNLGDAKVTATIVTNTSTVGSGQEQSAFTSTKALQTATQSPDPVFGPPTEIRFTARDAYDVLDANGATIASVTGVTSLDNLLAQAKNDGASGWPASFSALNDYPGYDVSLQGEPRANDSFFLAYNLNGITDNSNAIAMADIQSKGTIKISNNSTGQLATLHENYANMVGKVGEAAGRAQISLEAAEVMKTQSENWFDSVSGVNLDEEAANLVRFQQSYAASARIITTAQEIFDTILAAVR